MKSAINFFKKESVLCIAAFFALLSMVFVPPDTAYLDYIDFRVLALLFCLMAVVDGFRSCGMFDVMAQKLLSRQKNTRTLILVLVLLPFFASMLVTNDVALITFVPFVFPVLEAANANHLTVKVIVLQTLAANLGSMLTPVGNPQNLYLYSYYNFSVADFFKITFPLTAISATALIICSFLTKNSPVTASINQNIRIDDSKKILIYVAAFILCLLTVFRMINYLILLAIIVITFLIINPKSLKNADYGLLVTFIFFFIFSGNLGRIPEISAFLSSLTEKSTLLTSALASQIISNVPAAVLLSGFTENNAELLAGVNIGGLGTPVASLASLISLKFYLHSKNAKPISYIARFSAANFIGLASLLIIQFLLFSL